MIDFERYETKNKIRDAILRAKSDMYNSGCHNIKCIMAPDTLDFIKLYCSDVVSCERLKYGIEYTLIGMDIDLDCKMMYGTVMLKDYITHKQCMVMIDDPILRDHVRAIGQVVDTSLLQDNIGIWKEDENEMFKFNNNYNSDNICINRREFMVLPSKYIVNKDACILWDAKGGKTVVKRYKKDKIDPVKAFLWAYFIKNCGLTRTKANKYLEEVKSNYDEFIKNSK